MPDCGFHRSMLPAMSRRIRFARMTALGLAVADAGFAVAATKFPDTIAGVLNGHTQAPDALYKRWAATIAAYTAVNLLAAARPNRTTLTAAAVVRAIEVPADLRSATTTDPRLRPLSIAAGVLNAVSCAVFAAAA